jgi:hypothetical protein
VDEADKSWFKDRASNCARRRRVADEEMERAERKLGKKSRSVFSADKSRGCCKAKVDCKFESQDKRKMLAEEALKMMRSALSAGLE